MNGGERGGICSSVRALGTRSAQALKAVLLDIRCLYFIFRNPGTPWYARALLFLPLAYLCSPIQLIPNFIPVLGQMDDLFVIWVSNRLVRRMVDENILAECRNKAAAASFSIGFSGKSFYLKYVPSHPPQSVGEADMGPGESGPQGRKAAAPDAAAVDQPSAGPDSGA